MFYTRFLSPTDQKYAESSTYWQFLDYRPPVNFDRYTLKCDAKNSTSIYIYHPLDNRYRFSLSIGNTKNDHVATSTCLEWQLKHGKKVEKKIQKLADLWLVGEMVNRIGIYGSKVAEGLSAFQRRSCSVWYHVGLARYIDTFSVNLYIFDALSKMNMQCIKYGCDKWRK